MGKSRLLTTRAAQAAGRDPHLLGGRPIAARDSHAAGTSIPLAASHHQPRLAGGRSSGSRAGTGTTVRVLEVLRQPIEGKVVTIGRAYGSLTLPANFQLVAAMNPCGYYSDPHSRPFDPIGGCDGDPDKPFRKFEKGYGNPQLFDIIRPDFLSCRGGL